MNPPPEIREQVKRRFGRILKGGRLAHAYLLTGPRGAGKEALALYLARLFLCRQPDYGDGMMSPCGKCSDCRKIERDVHPDLTFVRRQGAMIRLDQIRNLQKTVSFQPLEAARRVCLILEADMINTEASNALLKTLEEPPRGTHLILTAGSTEALLPTIVSRCQMVRCGIFGDDVLERFLQREFDGTLAESLFLARMAEGSLSRAEELLKYNMLDFRNDLLELLASTGIGSLGKLFEISGSMSRERDRFRLYLQVVRCIVRDLMLLKELCAHRKQPGNIAEESHLISADRKEILARLARMYRWDDLERYAAWLREAERLADRNVNLEMLAESALIRFLRKDGRPSPA